MAKKIALTFGIIFLVVGLLGFIGNPIIDNSGNALFHANTAHNIVHIVSGLLFIIVAASAPQAAGMTLKIFGVVYLLVAILGFLATSNGQGSIFGMIDVNTADNWLHVVLGVVILLAGIKAGKGRMMNDVSMGGMPQ